MKSPEHVRGAAIRVAIRHIEAGLDIVIKETQDGLYVGNPHRPAGMFFRPAADLPNTHLDVYDIVGVRLLAPVLVHRGRFLPQEFL